MKLRNKILSFALPLTLIPFVLMALATYYFVIRANRIQIHEAQNKNIAAVVAEIRKELEAARKDISLLARVPAIVNYLEAVSPASVPVHASLQLKEEAARSILQLFFAQNPYYLQISLVDVQGHERVKFSKLPAQQELASFTEQDIFRRTLIMGRVQSPVTQVRPGRFAAFLTHEIKRNKFAGVVVLYLNTEAFQSSLRPLLASHNLSTFLFDDSGLIFAESLASEEEENCIRQANLVEEAASLLRTPTLAISEKELSFNNRQYRFSVYPAESFERFIYEPQSGENWFLGTVQTKAGLLSETTPFQAIFFALLIAAIGAVLWTATRYSRRVTVPLEQVSLATGKIARGQFDITLNVTSGDEITDLARSVKQMANELQAYQAKLIRSAKLASIGEMAAEISHEIQNRISGLSLWIQYLDSEIAVEDPRHEYLEEMKQGLRGFMDLLADLKQLYKTPMLQWSEVNLNELATASLHYVRARIQERKLEVELQLQADLPLIRGDADKLKSVLLNLIVNAIDAVEEEGRILVKTASAKPPGQERASDQAQDQFVNVWVNDNGKGIAEEDLLRIFYPFYSTKASGSGLGLAIASNLVTAHEGRLEVESHVGQGTTFKVTLPCVSSARDE